MIEHNYSWSFGAHAPRRASSTKNIKKSERERVTQPDYFRNAGGLCGDVFCMSGVRFLPVPKQPQVQSKTAPSCVFSTHAQISDGSPRLLRWHLPCCTAHSVVVIRSRASQQSSPKPAQATSNSAVLNVPNTLLRTALRQRHSYFSLFLFIARSDI